MDKHPFQYFFREEKVQKMIKVSCNNNQSVPINIVFWWTVSLLHAYLISAECYAFLSANTLEPQRTREDELTCCCWWCVGAGGDGVSRLGVAGGEGA